MNVFVTGGGGFLGRHLVAALRQAGHHVEAPNSKECDLLRDGCFAPWHGRAFDQIWHLAAWTQAGDFCLRHPAEQWVKNQQMNTRVLEWWMTEHTQAKLISIGTSCAYAPDLPLVETHYFDGQPIDSLYTYAMTKRMMAVGLRAAQKQYGLRHLTLVPSTLYGPGYHTDGRQLHFIFDLIRKILRGSLYGDPVVLWGDGYQRRELIHVHDFVQAALILAQHVDNELVNIGCGYERTIREFAELICEDTGYNSSQIVYDTSKYVGAKSKCLDIGKLRGLVPGFAPVSLEEGLPPVIEWMEEHHLR